MTFKVLIAGGSISGLTLALIFEKYGIDYLLLEKYPEIAPFLGTTVGINPNGARILDQLGIYSEFDKLGAKHDRVYYYDWDGKVLNTQTRIDHLMTWLLGYNLCFLNRQDLIRALYESIKDKSKILTAVEVVDVLEVESRVRVLTRDGTEFTADILVGADGVRSKVRNELWRIANEQDPGYIIRDKKCIISNYSCMTGVSPPPDCLKDRDILRSVNHHRSFLVLTQPGAKLCWWLAFFKHEKPLGHPHIPRYGVEDHEQILRKYGDDKIGSSTLKGLCDTAHHKVLVPVEEFTLEKWHYKRIVLLGDSCHKVHPIIGQGANQAIESAAYLADLLHDVALGKAQNSDVAIADAFGKYHAVRYPRALSIMHSGRFAQCIDSLDTWWYKFLALQRIIKQPVESGFLPLFAQMIIPAISLQYLPQPQHPGNVLYEDQIRIRPRGRSQQTTQLWMLGFLVFSTALYYLHFGSRLISPEIHNMDLYSGIQSICFNSIWLIESYRLRINSLFGVLSFITIALYTRYWEIAFAVFSAWYVYQSAGTGFYYPNPRAIDVATAMVLPYSALLAYSFPIYATTVSGDSTKPAWALAHILFPVLTNVLSRVCGRVRDLTFDIKHFFTGDGDIHYMTRYYSVVVLFAALTHVHTFHAGVNGSEDYMMLIQETWTNCLPIVAFCVFILWDMARVNIFLGSIKQAFAVSLLGVVVIGPAGVLAALWTWKEVVTEKARKEKTIQDGPREAIAKD